MGTITVLTKEGEEIYFPPEIDEEGKTWNWYAKALADGSLLLSLRRSRLRLPKNPPQGRGVKVRTADRVFMTKEQIRFPQGSWAAQRWETARYSKRDRLTNQKSM